MIAASSFVYGHAKPGRSCGDDRPRDAAGHDRRENPGAADCADPELLDRRSRRRLCVFEGETKRGFSQPAGHHPRRLGADADRHRHRASRDTRSFRRASAIQRSRPKPISPAQSGPTPGVCAPKGASSPAAGKSCRRRAASSIPEGRVLAHGTSTLLVFGPAKTAVKGRRARDLCQTSIKGGARLSDQTGLRAGSQRRWTSGAGRPAVAAWPYQEKARIDLWLKEISPSDELRHLVHADPTKWPEFVRAYDRELGQEPAKTAAADLRKRAGARR